jgi:hypothetical protein
METRPRAQDFRQSHASRSITKEPIVDPAFRDLVAKHAQTPQLFDFYKLKRDVSVIAP